MEPSFYCGIEARVYGHFTLALPVQLDGQTLAQEGLTQLVGPICQGLPCSLTHRPFGDIHNEPVIRRKDAQGEMRNRDCLGKHCRTHLLAFPDRKEVEGCCPRLASDLASQLRDRVRRQV